MSRKLRPRAPLTVGPSHVSQRTCEPIFGIDERRYLELLREHGGELTITAVGKLRVVSVEDLPALLSRLAASTRVDADDDQAADDPGDEDEPPETVDDVLGRLGRRRTA